LPEISADFAALFDLNQCAATAWVWLAASTLLMRQSNAPN
jgi:hypothetical protein